MNKALSQEQKEKLVALNNQMETFRKRNPIDPVKRIKTALGLERANKEASIFEKETELQQMKAQFHHLINQHQLIISSLEGLQVFVEVSQHAISEILTKSKDLDFYEHFDTIKKHGKFKAVNTRASLGTYVYFIDQRRLVLVDRNVDSSD